MIILFLVVILLFILQFCLAAISWSTRNSIRKKFGKPIASMLTPEVILNSNEKRFGKAKIKIVNYLDDIGHSEKGLLILHAKDLHKNSLYNNFKLFFYFYLTFPENNYVRELKVWENLLFIIQMFFLVLSIITINLVFNTFLIATLILQIFLILFSIFNFAIYSSYQAGVYTKCKKILKLDNVEEARLESLISNTSQESFEYPFEMVWRLIQFFRP